MMQQFLDAVKDENTLFVFIIISTVIGLNFRSFIELYWNFQTRRYNLLENALKLESLDEPTKVASLERLRSFYFKQATGITADKLLREKIVRLVEHSSGEIKISTLARIDRFLKLKNGKLLIEIDRVDFFGAIFNALLSVVMIFYSLVVFFLAVATKASAYLQFASLFLTGCLLLAFATFLLSQASLIYLAKRLTKRITDLEIATEKRF
jgi:hypothetical protein